MYLKMWDGTIAHGRDSGYPETKFRVEEKLEDFVDDFDTKKNERYFKLDQLFAHKVAEVIKAEKERLLKEEQAQVEEEELKLLAELKAKYEGE